jgi:iron complex outermembrane recepter protein
MRRALSGLLTVTLFAAAAAVAQDSQKRADFNIAPQALDTALIEFADQADVQLAVSAERIAGLRTKGVRGAFTHEGALRSLLADTGLTFRAIGERTYSVGDAKAQPLNGNDAAGAASPAMQPAPVAPTAPAKVAPTEGDRQPATEARSESEEEVLVTGTLIRDIAPVGSSLTVYGREQIDRSGAATVDQFVRKLPENLGSLDSSAVSTSQSGAGGFAQTGGNNFFGSGVNLRGLGPGATLVLLNGRRMASSGSTAGFVDVSNIPLAALQRVEVLSDGASALYGSDAIAGVANFVLRRDYQGLETSLRYGGATQGGGKELVASQLAGTAWDSGNVLLTLSHYDHEGILSTERDFVPEPFSNPASLLPERKQNSAFIAGRQQLFAGIEIAMDAMYTEREQERTLPSSAIITSDFDGDVKTLETGLTFERRSEDGWGATLSGTYSTVDQAGVTTLTGRAPTFFEANTRTVTSDLRFEGPLFGLPGGDARAALGVGYRREHLDDLQAAASRSFDRDVQGAYAEVFLPVLSRLELSIAGRYDDYEDIGSSTNPKVGLAWTPFEGVRLRGTYSTSFRAASLSDLTELPAFVNRNLADPSVPDRITTTLQNLTTGNSSLRPEEGESLTAGIDFSPAAIPELTIRSTYYSLQYDDRIARPPLIGNILTLWSQAATLAPFIQRPPSLADVQAMFARGPVVDLAGTGPAGVEAVFDQRITNMADSTVSGVDLAVQYGRPIGRSDLELLLRGTRTLELDYRPAITTPEVALVDLVGFPVGLRLHAEAGWSYRGFGSSVAVRYVDSYENQFLTPRGRVDSWTTADLRLSYQAAASTSFIGGLSIAIDVQNITDEEPPFVLIPPALNTASFNAGFDAVNASAVGRVVSLQIAKRW